MSLRLLPLEIPFPTGAHGTCLGPEDESAIGIGRSWQETAFELGALVIQTAGAGGALRDIRHIARRDLASLTVHTNHRGGGTTHVEVLCAGERILRVDFRYVPHHGVVSLRFHTSQHRVTQWVGSSRGWVDSVEAPRGFFINAVVGTRGTIAAGRCWPVGVLSCPFSMITTPSPPRGLVTKSYAHGAGLHDGKQRAFDETIEAADDDVRAIVVRCDFHVARVWVLSSAEYDVFATFKSRGPLGRDEFCLELTPGEVIDRVDIQSHKVVNAVRFVTSRQRETPWWGRADFGSVTQVSCRREDGRQFVGLYGTIGDNFVGSLGVVFGAPVVEQDNEVN